MAGGGILCIDRIGSDSGVCGGLSRCAQPGLFILLSLYLFQFLSLLFSSYHHIHNYSYVDDIIYIINVIEREPWNASCDHESQRLH